MTWGKFLDGLQTAGVTLLTAFGVGLVLFVWLILTGGS